MTKEEIISFNKNNVHVKPSQKGYGFSYFANRDFEIGEEVMKGWGKIVDHQTAHISVQIGLKKHYLPSAWTGRYWNHSCNPNMYVKTRSDGFPSLLALKAIKKDDEINYQYSMTEYSWIEAADETHVTCLCGEKQCPKRILSFSQLPPKEQLELQTKGLCSKYLLELKQ
jgi:SET domain-containing protein